MKLAEAIGQVCGLSQEFVNRYTPAILKLLRTKNEALRLHIAKLEDDNKRRMDCQHQVEGENIVLKDELTAASEVIEKCEKGLRTCKVFHGSCEPREPALAAIKEWKD